MSTILGNGIQFFNTSNPVNPSNTAVVVAATNKEGETTSQNMLSYPVPAGSFTTYRVNITAGYVSGPGEVLSITISYTDLRGNAASYLIPTSHLTNGHKNLETPALLISVSPGTTISIDAVIAGVVTYDYTTALEAVPLPGPTT